MINTIKNIRAMDGLSIQVFLDTLTTLTKIAEFNQGFNLIILKELVVKASGLFCNNLGWYIHDELSIQSNSH